MIKAAAGGLLLLHHHWLLPLICFVATSKCSSAPRHILMFVIDDYGFGDASYKNAMYNGTASPPTPTIDKLALSGVRLEGYYVQKLCSPTRTALLSGRYSYTLGQETDVIVNGQNCDLALNLLTIADHLQQAGWNTSAYGKWDAGMTVWGSTPACRGFDFFSGFYNAAEDYFTHEAGAYDYHADRRGEQKAPDPSQNGIYTTEAVTIAVQAWATGQIAARPDAKTFAYVAHQAVHGPMQVPQRFINAECRALVPASHPTRLIYCGMVRAVDESVKNITDTYKQLGIFDETIGVLTTDNGGHPADGGSNYPLRGQKATLYEGGVRGLAFLWGAGLGSAVAGTVQSGLMHCVDWLPTLVQGVAGLGLGPLGRPCPACERTVAPLDGVNQWPMLSSGAPSARSEVLLGLASTTCIRRPTPCIVPGEGALRIGKWKLIHGHLGGFMGSVPDPCSARSGHGQAAGKTFPLSIPANLSAPTCVFGWNPPPRADGHYELPQWPKDLDCDSLPCAMPPNSTYLTGRTMLFNLELDPFEHDDVASQNPTIVAKLMARLQEFNNTGCSGSRCLPDKGRPGIGPPGRPTTDPEVMGGAPVWLPWRGDKDPAKCSTDRRAPPAPPDPIGDLHSHISPLTLEPTDSGWMLVGRVWCFDTDWEGGGRPPMTVQLSVNGRAVRRFVANVEQPPGFINASGAPNLEHGYDLREVGAWVEELASQGKHRLDLDAFLDPHPAKNTPTTPLRGSPICFVDGKATCSGTECRALVPPPAPPQPHPSTKHPDIWFSPHFDFMNGIKPPPDFFTLLNHPESAWPKLAGRTSTFKLKMSALFPAVGSQDLSALVATVRARRMRTGLEIGGARWGAGRCDAASMLQYAKREQKQASRWLDLGGRFDSVTTDHAVTWDVRHELPQAHCQPPVSMATRIDVVAQVLASWRLFLGPDASIGFIESLGYWDITGPDGTKYQNVAPELSNISGWVPQLSVVTAMLLSSAQKHNPTPEVPLIDHYQIDYGMDGVEQDTIHYGPRPPVVMNYGRILGAESIMRAHGLESGVILNANAAHMRTYARPPPGCLVACDLTFSPSHSAALRTLNVTSGYMRLPDRGSQHTIFEQWQSFPNRTGPETAVDTTMWVASQAAAIVVHAMQGSGPSAWEP